MYVYIYALVLESDSSNRIDLPRIVFVAGEAFWPCSKRYGRPSALAPSQPPDRRISLRPAAASTTLQAFMRNGPAPLARALLRAAPILASYVICSVSLPVSFFHSLCCCLSGSLSVCLYIYIYMIFFLSMYI